MAAKKEINKIEDLPYYREEYTAQLAEMGIKERDELLEALKDEKRKKKIVDDLDGVGNKIADHWVELLSETRDGDRGGRGGRQGRSQDQGPAERRDQGGPGVQGRQERRPPGLQEAGVVPIRSASARSGESREASTPRCAATSPTARRSSRSDSAARRWCATITPPDSRRSWCTTLAKWIRWTPRCKRYA